MSQRLDVYLEVGDKRTFAGAVEWPGWSRAGKTADEALDALIAYGARYRRAMGRAATDLSLPDGAGDLKTVERLKGGGGTDFGVPSESPKADGRPMSAADLARLTRLLQASWRAVEKAAATAEGVKLQKGPRGGGRDLDKIVDHVVEAEQAYLSEFGVRRDAETTNDTVARWSAVRRSMVKALAARVGGEPPPALGPRRKRPFWTPRYLIRRSAWHALDHAWEIEDRASPATDDD